jgi:hypothetical protein
LLLVTGKIFNQLPHLPYLLVQLGNQARKPSFTFELFVHLDAVGCRRPDHLASELPLPVRLM